jgi:hypothetical protein
MSDKEIATIETHHISSQGYVVEHYDDGKVTIDAGVELVTGHPVQKVQKSET